MTELATMTRDDLNAHAAGLGFPDPDKFQGTKADLITALEQFAAEGSGEPTQPEVEASAEPDDGQLTQEVKAYLRNPSRVKPPAAVINFGADRPIRPRKE